MAGLLAIRNMKSAEVGLDPFPAYAHCVHKRQTGPITRVKPDLAILIRSAICYIVHYSNHKTL